MHNRSWTPGCNPGACRQSERGSALQALECPAQALDPVGQDVRELRWEGHDTTRRLLNLVQLSFRIKSPVGEGRCCEQSKPFQHGREERDEKACSSPSDSPVRGLLR